MLLCSGCSGDRHCNSPCQVVAKALVKLQHTVVVQVVIVIMADDHKVDVGQLRIIQLERRLYNSPA